MIVTLLSCAALITGQGLAGLGAPGGLANADPKLVAFENDAVQALNRIRADAKLPALAVDERLRAFARREAELAAKSDPLAKTVAERVKQQNIAPYGHYLQFSYGTDAKQIVADVLKQSGAKTNLLGEFAKIGLGAFWVPEKKPYYQVAFLLTRELDPLFGKPGLSPAQTDPVMSGAGEKIKKCYDEALKDNPNLRGDVIFQLVIGGDGGVTSAKIVRGLEALGFDRCSMAVINALNFPQPYKGKPVTLNHPMRFNPPQGSKHVGKLSTAQIASGFRQAEADFKTCYDKAAKDNADLAGTLTLALRVGVDGSQQNLGVILDEPAIPELTACVLERAKHIRFPPPEFSGEVEITYPLRFSPPEKSRKK